MGKERMVEADRMSYGLNGAKARERARWSSRCTSELRGGGSKQQQTTSTYHIPIDSPRANDFVGACGKNDARSLVVLVGRSRSSFFPYHVHLRTLTLYPLLIANTSQSHALLVHS